MRIGPLALAIRIYAAPIRTKQAINGLETPPPMGLSFP